MNAKPFDQTDIEDVFSELLAKNSHATSLEVKEELRTRGFWATQALVGPAVQDVANQLGAPFTNNGRFNTYQPIASAGISVLDNDEEEEEDGTGSLNTALPHQFVAPTKVRTPPADPADREPISGSPLRVAEWTCDACGMRTKDEAEAKTTEHRGGRVDNKPCSATMRPYTLYAALHPEGTP